MIVRVIDFALVASVFTLAGCATTHPDGKVTHRYFGYTAVTESGSGQARDIRNHGITVSTQTGLSIGFTHEKSAAIPPGKALYIFLPNETPPEPLIKLLQEAGIKDAAIITFPATNPKQP